MEPPHLSYLESLSFCLKNTATLPSEFGRWRIHFTRNTKRVYTKARLAYDLFMALSMSFALWMVVLLPFVLLFSYLMKFV